MGAEKIVTSLFKKKDKQTAKTESLDIRQLVQRLESWNLAVYPQTAPGFSNPDFLRYKAQQGNPIYGSGLAGTAQAMQDAKILNKIAGDNETGSKDTGLGSAVNAIPRAVWYVVGALVFSALLVFRKKIFR